MMWFLLRSAVRSGGRPAPARPAPDPKTSAIAWTVVATLVWACFWWPALLAGVLALLIIALAAADNSAPRRTAEDKTLAELLAKWDDDGRHKS
jgi:hypothetical protein